MPQGASVLLLWELNCWVMRDSQGLVRECQFTSLRHVRWLYEATFWGEKSMKRLAFWETGFIGDVERLIVFIHER